MNKRNIAKKILIFIVCVAVNLVGRNIATKFLLPVWLDMVGTCLSVWYLGLWGGILVGLSNNLISAVTDPMALVYAVVSLLAAVGLYICIRNQFFNALVKAAGASIIIGLVCVCVSTPLNLYFYEGYSGNIWGDAMVDMLLWYGFPRVGAALAGEVIVEVVDKQICVLLAYLIISLITKWTNGCKKKAKEKAAAVSLTAVLLFSLIFQNAALITEAAGNMELQYMGQIYNNTSGMMSSEANAIGETEDGFIWIGSYSGLTRYDGKNFEFIREGGIAGVTAMYTDEDGRLWIGTNDRGVVRYEDHQFHFLNEGDAAEMAGVRSFAKAADGSMYVGTTGRIYRIDPQDHITMLEQDIVFATGMFWKGDVLYGVTTSGDLFAMQGNQVVYADRRNGEYFFNDVADTSQGIMAGTSGQGLMKVTFEGGRLVVSRRQGIQPGNVAVIHEDREGRIWLCADDSVGYLDGFGRFVKQKMQDFDSAFESMYEDYQGNIWVASSRHGVMKLSQSPFADVFSAYGAEAGVANAVVRFDGMLYCGTDTGLVILDERSHNPVRTELTEMLENVRIRGLMVDSKDRLWVCTYQKYGLICYEKNGTYTVFNSSNSNLAGDRFRCALELSDGTIAAGTVTGLIFIRDGKITGTLGSGDGLENQQILCLMEGEDGTLYVGTDGAGIYLVRNGEICGRYGTAEGLNSGVILRMVPYEKGFFVVTGSSLCYVDEQGIRNLSNFPYFNNYDVIAYDRDVYVLSSAGIYVVNGKKLIAGNALQYRLFNVNSGLAGGLTANSWNFMQDGVLYFCGNNGVNTLKAQGDEAQYRYRFGIAGLECDGVTVDYSGEKLLIPEGTRRITITPAVHNYLLTTIKARFYVEGVDVRPQLADFDKLEPLVFTNLAPGQYRLRFQIYDSSGMNILEEQIYTLVKEPQMWENSWYKLYLVLVCVEIIAFFSWAVFQMRNVTKRRTQLEEMRRDLENQLDEQMTEVKNQRKLSEELLHQVVYALSETVDAKDRYTSGHSRRVAEYSRAIAQRMGKSEAEQEEIYFAGLLHDVGKIRIPDDIINKPGKLDDQEFNYIKLHPVAGYHILKDISGNRKFSDGARFHHERYDGKGYPNGLVGENIPEIARIIGVADAYDAMASNRSYRRALPQDVVRAEIEKNRGSQFDPAIADVMLQLIDEDREYNMKEMDDSRRTILVVDDENMNIKMVQFLMRDEGMYQIISATSGEQALRLLAENAVDMILLDIEMPGMNGFELLAKIREEHQTPVVFMTANKDLATIQKAETVGVEDYLTKPILPIALKEVVHSILK